MTTSSPTSGPLPAGLLLINLGTPDAPDAQAVRRYLREFLLDPRVIDLSWLKRNLIVRLFILPFRPKKSAEAYRQIWTEEGSPLLVHSQRLAQKVQQRLGADAAVELAMRYGNPSIASALARLHERGVDRVIVLPLFPQYASASTGSAIEAVMTAAAGRVNTPFLQVLPPFYDDPGYIDAFAAVARAALADFEAERVIFSYHGLPVRQCKRADDGGQHCLERPDCCDAIGPHNRYCYRAQCFATTRLLGDRLGLTDEQRLVTFQSRLGRERWIEPYTDQVIAEIARQGVRRAAIFSPAFVADCLETLEELGMRAAETFRAHGGERLLLIPSLNASDLWADAVVRLARAGSSWL